MNLRIRREVYCTMMMLVHTSMRMEYDIAHALRKSCTSSHSFVGFPFSNIDFLVTALLTLCIPGPYLTHRFPMKTLVSSISLTVPKEVRLTAKNRKVTVTGARGILVRSFDKLSVQIAVKGDKVTVQQFLGKRKQLACIRTCVSHIKNMITGVTKGFQYKMRLVYSHFPISTDITEEGTKIDIRNFLGEKRVRTVTMGKGCTVERGDEVKDQLIIKGIDLELVSQAAANIHCVALVRNKDIRKFLDGIYVYEKGHLSN